MFQEKQIVFLSIFSPKFVASKFNEQQKFWKSADW